MGYKACLFFILSVVCLGHAVTEIWLDKVDIKHMSNSLQGRAFGIPKNFWDTLVSCHILFPDGNIYEAYPNSDIPHPNVTFARAAAPFTSCNIQFKGVGVEFSGVYELLSTVRHRPDNNVSITRQRFNITITLSEYLPPNPSVGLINPTDPPGL